MPNAVVGSIKFSTAQMSARQRSEQMDETVAQVQALSAQVNALTRRVNELTAVVQSIAKMLAEPDPVN
jgi:outer membrane murein-binding lipoprotein Lpp